MFTQYLIEVLSAVALTLYLFKVILLLQYVWALLLPPLSARRPTFTCIWLTTQWKTGRDTVHSVHKICRVARFILVLRHEDAGERLIKWLRWWKCACSVMTAVHEVGVITWCIVTGCQGGHELSQQVKAEGSFLQLVKYFWVKVIRSKVVSCKQCAKWWDRWCLAILSGYVRFPLWVEFSRVLSPAVSSDKMEKTMFLCRLNPSCPFSCSAVDPSWHFSAGAQEASCHWQTVTLQLQTEPKEGCFLPTPHPRVYRRSFSTSPPSNITGCFAACSSVVFSSQD